MIPVRGESTPVKESLLNAARVVGVKVWILGCSAKISQARLIQFLQLPYALIRSPFLLRFEDDQYQATLSRRLV